MQPAVPHRNRDGKAHERRFQVGGAVSFGVTVITFVLRHERVEFGQQVVLHVRIGVFVDRQRGRGVEGVDRTEPRTQIRRDQCGNPAGDGRR